VLTNLIATHLLRVDSLTLDHAPPARHGGPRPAGDEMPAMLVIPAGRGLNEPHLIVMTVPGRQRLGRPSGWITTDVHLVVCEPSRRELTRQGRPGVFVSRRRTGLITRLARHRDGDIVVRRRAGGCELRLRDGRRLTVEGPAIAPMTAGVPPSYAMYASAVHCWQTAGISVSALEQAVVAVGRYASATAERSARFLVTGRAEIRLRRLRSIAAWHAA
jgi:hypothetical protein